MTDREREVYAQAYERATNRALIALGRLGFAADHPELIALREARDLQWDRAGLVPPGKPLDEAQLRAACDACPATDTDDCNHCDPAHKRLMHKRSTEEKKT